MSETTEVKAAKKPEADAPITKTELLALLAQMTQSTNESQKTMAEIIANALIEAKKPYIDPKLEENEEKFREANRIQAKQTKQSEKQAQDNCPHIAGCNALSEMRDVAGRTSIIWHRTDASEVLGICTNCQRLFRDNEPDYNKWRMMPSFNRMSMSGQRDFFDPMAAKQRARANA